MSKSIIIFKTPKDKVTEDYSILSQKGEIVKIKVYTDANKSIKKDAILKSLPHQVINLKI